MMGHSSKPTGNLHFIACRKANELKGGFGSRYSSFTMAMAKCLLLAFPIEKAGF